MCLSPIRIQNIRKLKRLKTPFLEDYIDVPCGKCVDCQKAKISERLCTLYMEFMSRQNYAVFVTLTLDDAVFLKDMSGVKREHVTPLLAEMRKHPELKYFLTSEYGSTTDRPHYHMIVYGFVNLKQAEDFFLEHWHNGMISVSECNDKRFTYVASCHITKCSHVPEYVDYDTGEIKQCNKPFTISSRCLGYDFVKKHHRKLYQRGVLYYQGTPFHFSPTIKTLLARLHYNSKFVNSTHFRLKERMADYKFRDKGLFDNFKKYLECTDEEILKCEFSPTEFSENLSTAIGNASKKFKTNYVNKNMTRQKM